MRIGAALAALLLLVTAHAVNAGTQPDRFVILSPLGAVGEVTVRAEGDTRVSAVRYDARSRGPVYESRLTLGASGRPIAYSVSGTTGLGQPMQETLTEVDGQLRWSGADGSGSGAAGSFYLPGNVGPEELGALYRYLARGVGAAALLPAGEARLVPAERVRLDAGGQAFAGRHFLLEGVAAAPLSIWIDQDGQLLAAHLGRSALLRAGLATDFAILSQLHLAAVERRDSVQPSVLAASRDEDRLLFRDIAVLDVEAGTRLDHQDVLVGDRMILATGPSGSLDAPRGAMVIEGRGKTLMPGLFDMHMHTTDTVVDGLLYIASGVTTVRSLGDLRPQSLRLRTRVEQGLQVGPRLLLSGMIDGAGPQAGPTPHLVANAQDVEREVADFAEAGYQQIKIYGNMPPALVPAVVSASARHGLRVSGHIPQGMLASEAVEAGYQEIQHANYLLLNFLGRDLANRTATIARLTGVAERGWTLDLGTSEVADFLALLKARNVVLDPTLQIMEQVFLGRVGQIPPNYSGAGVRFPPFLQRSLARSGFPMDAQAAHRAETAFDRMLEIVRRAHAAGIPIVAGTDGWIAGLSLHRELELYVRAGLSPMDAIRTATIVPARIMRMDNQVGSVRAGKLADLTIVSGDPLQDISAIRAVVCTVSAGRLYNSAELFQAAQMPRADAADRPAKRGCIAR